MIHNIGSGMIKSFINFFSKDKIDVKEIFKMLSMEMGGDGSEITKDQLSTYVKKIEAGEIKVSKKKMMLLKQMLKNWDKIAQGDDSITLDEFKKHLALLLSIIASDADSEEYQAKNSQNEKDEESEDYLQELLNKLGLRIEELTSEALSEYLKTLLSDETSQNEEEIAAVTNMMAEFETSSLSSEVSYEV